MFIAAIEISKKQQYIFKSNRLKEVLGASILIKYITEYLSEKIANENNGEIIYSGGGCSFFKFNSNDDAKKFTQELSFKVLKNYEGIELYLVIREGNNINKLRSELAQKKLTRGNSFKKISFGVEEICKSSSTPAIGTITNNKQGDTSSPDIEKHISNETATKVLAYEYMNKSYEYKELCKMLNIKNYAQIKKILANTNYEIINKNKEYVELSNILDTTNYEQIKEMINDKDYKDYSKIMNGYYNNNELIEILNEENYDDFEGVIKNLNYKHYILDLDDFGSDSNSYMAVVSIDGNKMGDMVSDIMTNSTEENKSTNLKAFSDYIKYSYETAFLNMIEHFKDENNKFIRPLIVAGDDVLYLIKSELAISSVRHFAKELSKVSKNIYSSKKYKNKFNNSCLTVGAGIAFVNKKAPIYKSIELAEELNKSSKLKINQSTENISALDWHILQGEYDEIDEIRNKFNKQCNFNNEGFKPIEINDDCKKDDCKKDDCKKDDCKKDDFFDKLDELYKKYKDNKDTTRIGKLKELLTIFPEGREKTKLYVKKYMLDNELNDSSLKDLDKQCYELIEMINDKFYTPLKTEEGTNV